MSHERAYVIIVNNEVAFARLLNTLLRDEEQLKTLLLQVGELAYESIKQEQPNLIVLDISFDQPEVSWHLIDLLMLDPQTLAIPILLCSANDELLQQRREKVEAAGYRVLEKPFELDELLGHIRTLLTERPE